jgi:phosphoenolpyruvate-protein kinase (PTS system EI component)
LLEAPAWPTEEEHTRLLAPVLAALAAQTATVRLLDFGGDKTPPFLDGDERGIQLLLQHPDALRAQLAAVVAAGADTRLRILLPMVESAADVEAVRALLPESAGPVQLGAMVETAHAADNAAGIAAAADFLSIGTNDLTHSVLGLDRFAGGAAFAYHPAVLRAVAATIEAAHDASIPVEVCGEAASDEITLPLLVGLGVDELSVGAARVGIVRAWVRLLVFEDATRLAREALALQNAFEVAQLVRPVALRLAEAGDAAGESLDGRSGVAALGPQS